MGSSKYYEGSTSFSGTVGCNYWIQSISNVTSPTRANSIVAFSVTLGTFSANVILRTQNTIGSGSSVVTIATMPYFIGV
jgi:hypothetical protein